MLPDFPWSRLFWALGSVLAMAPGGGHRTISAKLIPPALPDIVVARRRLDSLVRRVPAAGIGVVAGPAGSGKTVLLSRWHAAFLSSGGKAAWLSVDPSDRSSRRFVSSLAAALDIALPGVAAEAVAALQAAAGDGGSTLAGLLPLVTSRIEALEAPFALFLDDFHLVADPAVLTDLVLLVRYLPPRAILVLGSRGEPLLPLARLRAEGRLIEIGWRDLRFTGEEAEAFLRLAGPTGLPAARMALLVEKAEGWIAGLRLAARRGGSGDEAAESFSGGHGDVAAYFMEEVYRHLPEERRRFLRRTALLERMTGPACDAVTGHRDGGEALDRVRRAGLFVLSAGTGSPDAERAGKGMAGCGEDGWRYHRLFTEFLVGRLMAEEPEVMGRLRLSASRWHESEGDAAGALRQALAGGLHERAVSLLTVEGRELFRRSRFHDLRRWMEALPRGTVEARPDLCVLHAWALAYLGDFSAAHARITVASAALRRGAGGLSTPRISAELSVLTAALGVIQTDEAATEGLDPASADLFRGSDPVLRAFTEVMLGYAARQGGDLKAAAERCERAIGLSEGVDAPLANLLARFNLATVAWLSGQPSRSGRIVEEGLSAATGRGWLGTVGVAFLRVARAVLHQDHGRPEEALGELDEAVDVLKATGAYGFLGVALVERAQALGLLGRPEEAADALAEARDLAARHDVMRVRFRADLAEIRLAADAGKVAAGFAAAARAAAARTAERIPPGGPFPEWHEALLLQQLRLMLAAGRHAELIRLSGPALRSAGATGRIRHAVGFLALQAAAWQGLGDIEKGFGRLEQALLLLGREVAVRPFLLPGEGLVPLLGAVAALDPREGRAAEPARRLLSLLGGPLPVPEAERSEAGDLHLREMQILRLLSEGLRNREIGARLLVSEETVKWYLKRLYSKLRVTTRTSAVGRARELGLIA